MRTWQGLLVVLTSFVVISGAFLTHPLLSSRSVVTCRTCRTQSLPRAAANIPNFVTIRDPKIDSVFKILFGEEGGESRTMAFLNDVLYPDEKDDRIEKLQFLDRTKDTMLPKDERVLYFDILVEACCRTVSGKRFIIEMQRQSSNAAAERWITYGARELLDLSKSIQQDKSIPSAAYWDELLPVKVVTILEFNPKGEFLKNPSDVIVEWDIREKVTSQVVSKVLSWSFICLARFNPQDDCSVGVKGRAWLHLLKQKDRARVELTNELVANNPTIEEAYQRIACLTEGEERQADKSQDLQGLIESKDAGKFADGKAEGERIGEARGKAEGERIGEARGKAEIAAAMLKSNMSVQQVAQLTGLADPDVQALKVQLQQDQ